MSDQLSAQDKYTIQLSAPRAGIAGAKAMSTATGLTGQVLAEKPPKLPFKGGGARCCMCST